jgi:DNA-binding NtrC family response regulator
MIDDDSAVLRAQSAVITDAGFGEPLACTNGSLATNLISTHPVDVILLDLLMPGEDGETLLSRLQELKPEVPVIVITAVRDVDTAVRCVQKGAYDYLVKPLEPDRLLGSLRRAMTFRAAASVCRAIGDRLLDGQLRHPEHFSSILTADPKMRAIFLYLEAVAPTAQPVLLNGETGTGKDLLARAVHLASGRTGQFHAVNVAGVDESMINDTLFGHIKGAYTSAAEPRKGILSQAEGGTVLLDEIGDLGLASQIKLLRVLESGEYYPLGSDLPRRTTARFLFSTHFNLEALVNEGKFRNDLYYRIAINRVRIPPLRERRSDIPMLTEQFVGKAAEEIGRRAPRIPAQLYSLLNTHAFPGNVRELRSMVFSAVSNSDPATLSLAPFKAVMGDPILLKGQDGVRPIESGANGITFGESLPTLHDVTRALIGEALKRAGGDQSIAAELLGISHQALNKRLKRNGKNTEVPRS